MQVEIIPPAYSWESQAAQYAPKGQPGLSLERHMVSMTTGKEVFGIPPELAGGDVTVIDCLLHRDDRGDLDAILNHYDGKNPLEAKDNVNVWVRPDSRQRGLGTAMVQAAMERWPGVKLERQRYTRDGLWILRKLMGSEIDGL